MEKLLKTNPFFRAEISKGVLINPDTIQKVQPKYCFAGHMHVTFLPIVTHEDTGIRPKVLALDKFLVRRDLIQVLDVPTNEDAMP